MKASGSTALAVLLALLCAATGASAGDACLGGIGALTDPIQVAVARATVDTICPCDTYDGSSGYTRGAYQKCARGVVDELVGIGLLRGECRTTLRRDAAASVCGRKPDTDAVPCIRRTTAGAVSCTIKAPAERCEDRPGVYTQVACPAFDDCLDAADTDGDLRIGSGDDGRCSDAPVATPSPAFTPPPTPAATPTPPPVADLPYPTGDNGLRLAQLVNVYRAAHGKAPLPISTTMSAVAGAHAYDLLANPNILTAGCNLHSWSKSADWSGCCYDDNGTQASCMWVKPSEIAASFGLPRYSGRGFEITYRGWFATPEMVIDFFDKSPGHKAVLLNTGTWGSYDPWPAMGAAMRGDFAVIWFGSTRG
jgi:hypothetical protein